MRALHHLALGAAFVALTACSGGAVYYRHSPGPPPPPLAAVVVGVAPSPGFVWVEGYYDWGGGNHRWVPGRWVRPPRSRAVWEPGHWAHHGRREIWISGRWR